MSVCVYVLDGSGNECVCVCMCVCNRACWRICEDVCVNAYSIGNVSKA